MGSSSSSFDSPIARSFNHEHWVSLAFFLRFFSLALAQAYNVAALFIEYPVELFYKSQFGFVAFLINGTPFVVFQHFPRFCALQRIYHEIDSQSIFLNFKAGCGN